MVLYLNIELFSFSSTFCHVITKNWENRHLIASTAFIRALLRTMQLITN